MNMFGCDGADLGGASGSGGTLEPRSDPSALHHPLACFMILSCIFLILLVKPLLAYDTLRSMLIGAISSEDGTDDWLVPCEQKSCMHKSQMFALCTRWSAMRIACCRLAGDIGTSACMVTIVILLRSALVQHAMTAAQVQ